MKKIEISWPVEKVYLTPGGDLEIWRKGWRLKDGSTFYFRECPYRDILGSFLSFDEEIKTSPEYFGRELLSNL